MWKCLSCSLDKLVKKTHHLKVEKPLFTLSFKPCLSTNAPHAHVWGALTLPSPLCGSVSNSVASVGGALVLLELTHLFLWENPEILLSGYGRGMTHELESSIFPPFWVLNPNLRSEYLNHSLDLLWWLSLPIFYISKAIQGLEEKKY
jgi:hypothetical protein